MGDIKEVAPDSLDITEQSQLVWMRVRDARALILKSNLKLHDIGGVIASLKRYGWQDKPRYDATLGAIKHGNGRTEALAAMEESIDPDTGKPYGPPRGVALDSDGAWCIQVDIGIDARTEAEARAYAIDANNLTLSGGDFDLTDHMRLWEDGFDQQLAELAQMDEAPVAFDAEDIDALLNVAAAIDEKESIKGEKPNPRNLPLDVIYTLDMADCTCCLAAQAGIGYGFRSAQYRLCPYCGQLSGRHRVVFIDNEFKDYEHSVHVKVVEKHKPKYSTVRDIMSKRQCKDAGIKFYTFDQIMEWAEEIEQYAENVIVIPKYDCLDDIPERFVLGYSVPTSYGGTPIPADKFRGRRVHLLGGSWKAQLEYLALLGDDVVSLDTNYIQRQARLLGVAVRPDGSEFQCQDIGLDYLTNVRYAALALSFGAIGAAVNCMFAGADDPA